MFTPFGFVRNALAPKVDSKVKRAILETEDQEVMEQIVDILTVSDIMCFIRLNSKMYHGRVRSTIYRIYISESCYKRAKTALQNSDLDFREIHYLNE